MTGSRRSGKAAARALAGLVALLAGGLVPGPAAADEVPDPTPTAATVDAEEEEAEDPGEEARFAAVRRGAIGNPLPDASLTSLDGIDMSFRTARGSWLLVALADRDARDEALAWFERHARKLAETEDLQVLSLLFPGKVGFVVPRAVAQKKILEDVRRILRRSRQALPEELRSRFDSRRLLWHVDWRRKLTAELGAPRHRLCLVLADPEGRVVASEDRVDEAALERLLDLVGRPGGTATGGHDAAGEDP